MNSRIESNRTNKTEMNLVDGRLLLAGHEFAVEGKNTNELIKAMSMTIDGPFNPVEVINRLYDLSREGKLGYQSENGVIVWHVAPDSLIATK